MEGALEDLPAGEVVVAAIIDEVAQHLPHAFVREKRKRNRGREGERRREDREKEGGQREGGRGTGREAGRQAGSERERVL